MICAHCLLSLTSSSRAAQFNHESSLKAVVQGRHRDLAYTSPPVLQTGIRLQHGGHQIAACKIMCVDRFRFFWLTPYSVFAEFTILPTRPWKQGMRPPTRDRLVSVSEEAPDGNATGRSLSVRAHSKNGESVDNFFCGRN